MVTIKQIAEELGIAVQRARLCVKKSAVEPIRFIGRVPYYDRALLPSVVEAHQNTPTRKRNARPTTDTQTESTDATAQGSETTLPAIDPVAGDTQALPESQPGL